MFSSNHFESITNLLLKILLSVFFVSSYCVFALPEDTGSPSEGTRLFPLIRAAPKSLAEQKLDNSSYPEEAEIFCGTENCLFGLSRGIVIGGRAFDMLYAPMRKNIDPRAVSGLYNIVDVFGGFQVLRDPKGVAFMNAQIGYRHLYFSDGENTLSSQGLTVDVNYTQKITPIYVQGVEFSSYLISSNTYLNHIESLNNNSVGHDKLNNSTTYFYQLSQSYPTLKISFPATLELINWGTRETGLPMPIHTYFQVSPFYIQNNIRFSANNVTFSQTEQNFGTRIAALGSYESTEQIEKSGRYAFKTALGLDLASSEKTKTTAGNTDLNLPRRPVIQPYIELGASWQF